MTVLVLRKTDLCVLSLKNLTGVRFFGSLSGNRGVLGETSPNESLADKLVCLFLLHKKGTAGMGRIAPYKKAAQWAALQSVIFNKSLQITQTVI